jgi:hypothetical protein
MNRRSKASESHHRRETVRFLAAQDVNPSDASTQLTSAPSDVFFSFDPNGAGDGNIDTATWFRLGVMYSLASGTTPGQGDSSCVRAGGEEGGADEPNHRDLPRR